MRRNARPPHARGLAAAWLYDHYWNDTKCEAGCEGELVTEGLVHDEEEIESLYPDGSPNYQMHAVYEWSDPRLAEIVLQWRVRDAFGFVTWEAFSLDARSAFEAYLLAGEVRAGYIYAAGCNSCS